MSSDNEIIYENVLDAVLESRRLESKDGCIVVMRRDGAVSGVEPIERVETDIFRRPALRQTIAGVLADGRIIFDKPAQKVAFVARCEEGDLKVLEDARGALTIPNLQF